jgi:hypothetical protein
MAAIQGTYGVSRYQAVQEDTNRVKIELMMKENEPEVSRDELVRRCQNVLGQGTEVQVLNTDRKNLKAKFRPVISKLTMTEEPRWTVTRW